LLIVIAIIGILASIILVSLNSARQRARMAEFKSTVASWQAAMIVECDKTTPAPGSVTWPAANTSGSITTPATCGSGQVTGGVATASAAAGGNCTGTLGATGTTFAGTNC
jgi:type II secretory pathway pseudopilin PulG